MGGRAAAQGSDLAVDEMQVFDEIKSALGATDSPSEKAKRIAEAVRQSRNYRWAGVYEIDSDEIAAVAWTGTDPPAFPRFPKTQGLCGAVIREGAAVVVGDVANDPRYLTTFGTTRSEIVVPVFGRAGKLAIGLIDVESEQANAFHDADRIFLEGCAALVAKFFE
jgi:GAF domain-containing protein